MQVDDPAAARLAMESIHVLGYQRIYSAGRFECGECRMGQIRLRICYPSPAGKAPRPVALSNLRSGHEVRILYRACVFPVAISVTIVRNA